MQVFNTMTRRLEVFEPLEAGHVRMYTCGPTVYNYAHIGNFRAYIFEDLLRRQLQANGYRVTQVMNLTDVDDKTIKGALAAGVPLDAYTRPFKDAFFADLIKLGIERAEHYPAATDHVAAMITLIESLMASGHAYASPDGSVYYNVGSFPGYGKLAGLDRGALRAGTRVAHDEYDRGSVADFALWKAWDEADGAVVWESPWGRGRPGWHVECSAMAMAYLGQSFDLHTGGVDNIFPHHENEIAQSEGATGKPFVRYWMHCGYLIVNGAKMSKSLGNFFTIRDLLELGHTGREIRYVLLSAHYRQPLNFTMDALAAARVALGRMDAFRERLGALAGVAAAGGVPDWGAGLVERFWAAMNEDLNTPLALAAIFDLIHEGNRQMDAGEGAASGAAALLGALERMDRVLGVLSGGAVAAPDAEVLAMLEARNAARQARAWAESDRLRDLILASGWVIRDTAEGARLYPRQA